MRKLSTFYITGLSFLLFSCITVHNVTIDTLQAPPVILPQNIQRIVFLYNMPVKTGTGEADNLAFVSDTALARHLFVGATDKFNEAPYVAPALKYVFSPAKPSMLKLKFDSLCNQFDADAVVYLNQFKWSNNLSEAVHYLSDIDMYYTSQVVTVQADWKIYSRHSQQYVDQFIQRDTSYWDAYGNSPTEASQKLPILYVAIPSALYAAGGKWAVRYNPSWITSKRFYYETSNKKMRQASDLALQGDWTAAAEIWTEIVYNPKSSRLLTAKAAFNMALAAEMADNIDAALEWIAKSHFYQDDSYTTSYLEILERRKIIKKKFEALYPSSQD